MHGCGHAWKPKLKGCKELHEYVRVEAHLVVFMNVTKVTQQKTVSN